MATHFKGKPAEEAALDVFVKLVRAAAAVESRSGRLIAEAGLTATQFGALETLFHLGPMTAGRLARKHLKTPNNFTLVLGNLEKLGLVRRERDLSDKRVVRVSLTPAGQRRVEEIMPGYVEHLVGDFSVLTREEQATLAELLRRLGRSARGI